MAVRRARGARSPRRRHAQHFLRSAGLAAAIVRDARVGSDELVLDLGAGTGALAAELGRQAGKVRAIEIDPALVARLRERFGHSRQVEVVHGDVLRVPLPYEPFRVVANVPFNLTTAIMRTLLDDPRTSLVRADLIVELDVAWKRARVSPSTALGVYWGAWYEFAVTRRIHRSAFAPPPDVDAGLLGVTRRPVPLVPASDARAYRAFVTAGFERDALRRVVSRRELKRLAVELGFAPGAPASELDQHQWAGVFRYVRRGPVDSRRHEPL